MQDEALAIEIVQAVVAAAAPHGVPVTLKMRTGWCADVRNAPVIALAAEAAGVMMLTVHGRTREQGYKGFAEHDTVAHIKSRVNIPVVANGDITSPQQARDVLKRTGADAIMIGRAAQGRPWIFREIAHFLATGEVLPPPDLLEVKAWLLDHLLDHYSLYGDFTGVRSARKHLGWYAAALPIPAGEALAFRQRINTLTTVEAQLQCVDESIDAWTVAGYNDMNLQEENWKLAA
jgi:tRNA-dihydrouridine synthase B